MAKIRSIPLGTYPAGVYPFGPIATPNGLAGFDLRIGRTGATPPCWTDPTTGIRLDLQFSYDGGVTYTPIGQNSWEGTGGAKVQHGVELVEEPLTWRFSPDEPNMFKGQITVSGPAVTTYMDVTVL